MKYRAGQSFTLALHRFASHQNDGIATAHALLAKSLNAKLVICGRKIGDKQFNLRFGLLGSGRREFRTFCDAVGPALHDVLVFPTARPSEFWISVHGVLACARSSNVFPTIAVSIGSTRPALSGVSITP
jgi:hypothetical protein